MATNTDDYSPSSEPLLSSKQISYPSPPPSGNYAKFLKEVRGDVVKAEEYCERAILVNPNDANVVSMYAELVWEVHKDFDRAEKYFDQAVQAEPNDW
ncbi:hypothetical protein IFM89_025335 [Coptis chinensis]|uniref:Uncharacterized protein n=1 Tax=Coptis chinensis TaxID=261450 RepID=A0A835I7W3_9MAGN|nr:hypothetical protein IFM89_025335 [Coptis chinensis]